MDDKRPPSPRDVFHNAVDKSLMELAKALREVSERADVIEACQAAFPNEIDPRTLRQIMLDDFMDAFITIMRDVPDKDIPDIFYRKMLAYRNRNQGLKETEFRSALNDALAEKRKGEDRIFEPEFAKIKLPQDVGNLCIGAWYNLISNFGQLAISNEALTSNHRAAAILDRTMAVFHKKGIKIIEDLPSTLGATPQDDPFNEDIEEFNEDIEEIDALADKLEEAKDGMPPNVYKHAAKQLRKLDRMNEQALGPALDYLETLLSVPWGIKSDINQDLQGARAQLDEDHFGLDKVKERILKHLAVQNRVAAIQAKSGEVIRKKGTVLVFDGPPGIGKTSLGESIAKAQNRKFVRSSMAGIHDESDIRGHRKTYIGAEPGDIAKALIAAGSMNPVMLLDEVDKVSPANGHNGSPSAALLEVLDPAQNHSFKDHFLGVELDLSDVLFIGTSNDLSGISPPLLDRMEIIRLNGYLNYEKIQIAKRYLIPKQMKAAGLEDGQLSIDDAALDRIVLEYTQEAGVRRLERTIGTICSNVVMAYAEGRPETDPIAVTAANLETYAGVSKMQRDMVKEEDRVGLVNGLAYTALGGILLPIEAVTIPAKEFKLTATGMLGEVMKESISVADRYVRANAEKYGIDPEKMNRTELGLHAPEGAVPKDGPSAGLALATVCISALTGVKIRQSVAMTGEINLRGQALPIGGLREKLQGAVNAGVKT
ncbi:MAG TPA: S16 family serine protease, partial [Micavibrio sp.]